LPVVNEDGEIDVKAQARELSAQKAEIAALFRQSNLPVSVEVFQAATAYESLDVALQHTPFAALRGMVEEYCKREGKSVARNTITVQDYADNPFQKATKDNIFLRLALDGPSGSGKTMTGLSIAVNIVPGGRVAVIDTERGSARKYSDMFAFDVLELKQFDPEEYIKAIHAAVKYGYDVLLVDSLTHAWNALLNFVDTQAKSHYSGNSFAAWKDANPKQAALVDAMLDAKLHLVGTMRSKMEYVLEKDERTGKTIPRKVGMAPIQRDGLEYEFDIVGSLSMQNELVISKSRCPLLTNNVYPKAGKEVADILAHWLTN
jgi:AAA domain